MRIKILVLAALLLICSGLAIASPLPKEKPATTPALENRRNNMIGKWYGEVQTIGSGKRKWIIERFQNGTYRVTFRLYDELGKYVQQTEVGDWGISGRTYFTIVRGLINNGILTRTDPSDPYIYDAYKINKLDDREMMYEDAESGDTFRAMKVSSEFTFPN